MNISILNRKMPAVLLAASLFFIAWGAQAEVRVLAEQNFESGVVPNSGGWGFGLGDPGGSVTVSKNTAENYNGSLGSLKGNYPVPTGGGYIWGVYDVAALNLSDVYIEFWAKMPNVKHGIKFLKIFGQRAGSNYSNTTFGLDYTGVDYGAMYVVSFGDGSSDSNDTQNIISFDGTYPNGVGRSYGKAKVLTPQKKMWSSSNWGKDWHHFRFHVKYNTGTTAANEVADGEYYVEIDGVVYVDAKGIFNRHYSNKPIQTIGFFDWSQTGKYAFDIWYDNIKITTGGFDGKNPIPPLSPSLIY